MKFAQVIPIEARKENLYHLILLNLHQYLYFTKKIVKSIQSSSETSVKKSPIPSTSLLRISLCPQYESRMVSKRYSCRLKITRAIQVATMRKNNIDSYYNHKINQYANSFILEFNKMVYQHHWKISLSPTNDNNLTF